MARPIKDGIDYFSFDVDFLRDLKVRRIMRACGNVSIAVLICILSTIYRENGYYMTWSDDLAFIIAEETMATEEEVLAVLDKSLEVGLFDRGIFKSRKVLTSRGIQKRYLKATERRSVSRIDSELSLLFTNE